MTIADKLISIGSSPLASIPNIYLAHLVNRNGARYEELNELLMQKNGFYAFEGALHVLPAPAEQISLGEIDLVSWNTLNLWRFEYEDLEGDLFFFAEDAFGVQFAIDHDKIVTFDPESAEISPIADNINSWAVAILNDYNLLTGFPVIHDWQLANGVLQRGKRLLPKIPFILGGNFEPTNLAAVDAVEGMLYRGDLWRQIRDLPDGTQVRLKALPTH